MRRKKYVLDLHANDLHFQNTFLQQSIPSEAKGHWTFLCLFQLTYTSSYRYLCKRNDIQSKKELVKKAHIAYMC